MRRIWDDVNARARGLANQLLGRAGIEQLALATNVGELALELERAGYPGAGRGASPEELERAVGGNTRRQLSILARWCGERTRFLPIAFEDEDRRSLRSLIRGALGSVASGSRLRGLVPTPALPERALGELAQLSTAAEIAATLTAWRNPYGEAIRDEAARTHPNLFRMELAINRLFAVRATSGAKSGGSDLRAFVEESIDLENASAALALSATELEPIEPIEPVETEDPEACFIEGGRCLDRKKFSEAARSDDARGTRQVLAGVFAGTVFGRAFEGPSEVDSDIELELFRVRLEALVARARREPLSVVLLLAFVFRARAEGLDLRKLIWARALGAGPSDTVLGFVSV